MIELLIVLAIVAVAISAATYSLINSGKSDAALERSEEYYRQYAMLEANVRRDVRSATAIASPVPSEYRIRTVASAGTPGEEVTYKVSSNGKVIERRHKGGVEKYDFTKLVDGEFVFRISY